MKRTSTRILIIYANSDPVMRNSVSVLLHSFRKHLRGCEVFYHNSIFNRSPFLSRFREVDYVLFHHSVTTVWNRKRYQEKISSWMSSIEFSSAYKIALMQDEYKNTDLVREFLTKLEIDKVMTLAPEHQWRRIYGDRLVHKGIFSQYFAGYLVQQQAVPDCGLNRDIDIGYRTDWTKMHVKLGKTGLMKRDIASAVKRSGSVGGLLCDVEAGSEYFLGGKSWIKFLKKCRYVVGVPSGSSVLDVNGSIESSLMELINKRADMNERELYESVVEQHESTLELEVIAPRHFEAMQYGVAQILIESSYNGVLEPWKHYLPVKRDLSNLDEILDLVPNESLRLEIVENCYRDIVLNHAYSYEHFVQQVFPKLNVAAAPKTKATFDEALSAIIELQKHAFIKIYAYFRVILRPVQRVLVWL